MGVRAQFPSKPISQPEISPTLAREITSQDLQNIAEDLMTFANIIYNNPTFAIISGINFISGNNYSSGYIILNGQIYYFPGGALLNKNLIPDNDTVELSITGIYNDDNSYPIFRLYSVSISGTSGSSTSPKFVGNMNDYRINLSLLFSNSFQIKNLIDITQSITISETINSPLSSASLCKGNITITGFTTSTYNYNISFFANLVCFDLIFNSGSYEHTFNIKDDLGNIIYTTNNPSIIKVLAVKASTGWTIYDISSLPYLLNQVLNINEEIETIQENELTFGNPTDSGDKSTYDFTLSNFTIDNNPHDLDLSSLIPNTAKFVILRVQVQSNDASAVLQLYKYGNSHLYNSESIYPCPHGAFYLWSGTCIVAVDGNQKITYRGNLITTILNIVVAGWI